MSGEQTSYPRPPITEAVLEIRFKDQLSLRDTQRCSEKFKRQYKKVEELNEIAIRVDHGSVAHQATPAGYKMTAESGVDVLMLNTATIATVRLAPYQGWNALLALAQSNFETMTKVVGRREITRLGLRYVNRIDIPAKNMKDNGFSDFITVGITMPTEIGSTAAGGPYFVNVQTVHATGAKLIIQTGPVEDVLLDHKSVLLDIDSSIDGKLPQRVDDLWALANELRITKNTVFEYAITDRARELFQ